MHIFAIICIDYMFHVIVYLFLIFFFFKQKTAYEMRISDWSSDVCSSDLATKLRTTATHPNSLLLIDVASNSCRYVQSDERNHALSGTPRRSEEHTSELQSLMRISYAVFCLKKKKRNKKHNHSNSIHITKSKHYSQQSTTHKQSELS